MEVMATMNQFGLTHYVPIVRWKEAERTALAKLADHAKTSITPLIELARENFMRPGSKALSTDEAVNKISGQLFRYWGERPFFIDLYLLSQDSLTQGPNHPLTLLGNYASNMKMSLIPVTGIGRDVLYQSAVRAVISRHNQGACLRLSREDINRPTLAKDINDILSFLNLTPKAVDLLVDFQIIDQSAPTFNTLCERIPSINKWRNFIVASGAFPEDLRALGKNDIHRLERLDWISWKDQAIAKSSVMRMPIYSDYTIQHALYLNRKGRQRYSASIRYTADNYWVIMRGEDVFNRDGPGFGQWPANAVLLCEQPEYCQETFSDGDKYIREMSLQFDQTGNATTWLRAGINHHMTFVVHQLANLPETSAAALS